MSKDLVLIKIPSRTSEFEVHSIEMIDFNKEYPLFYNSNSNVVWLVVEDGRYKHYLVNPKLIKRNKNLSEFSRMLVNITLGYLREEKLKQIGI